MSQGIQRTGLKEGYTPSVKRLKKGNAQFVYTDGSRLGEGMPGTPSTASLDADQLLENERGPIRRDCPGPYCLGKPSIYYTDPHSMCFRCRGPYHDYRNCEFCAQVPQSTRATWMARCDNWLESDPSAPPPPSKRLPKNKHAADFDVEEPMRSSRRSKHAPSREFYDYSDDTNSSSHAPEDSKQARSQMCTTDDVVKTDQDRLDRNSRSEVEDITRIEGEHCLDVTHWFNSNRPLAYKSTSMDTTSYYRLVNRILHQSPDLIEMGGILTRVPLSKYGGISGPLIRPPSLPLESTFQMISEEKLGSSLKYRKQTRCLNNFLNRYKVNSNHMNVLKLPVVNESLAGNRDGGESPGIKTNGEDGDDAMERENKTEPGNKRRESMEEDSVSVSSGSDRIDSKNVNIEGLQGLDEFERFRMSENCNSVYQVGTAGVSIANHLLLLSQYGLGQLSLVEPGEVGNVLLAIQKASEDVLNTFLTAWNCALVNQRTQALMETKLARSRKEALVNLPHSKDGLLFSSDVDSVVYDICDCGSCKTKSCVSVDSVSSSSESEDD